MTIGLTCVLLILTDRATWQYSGGILTEVPPKPMGLLGFPERPGPVRIRWLGYDARVLVSIDLIVY
jgi:hypothetical protein